MKGFTLIKMRDLVRGDQDILTFSSVFESDTSLHLDTFQEQLGTHLPIPALCVFCFLYLMFMPYVCTIIHQNSQDTLSKFDSFHSLLCWRTKYLWVWDCLSDKTIYFEEIDFGCGKLGWIHFSPFIDTLMTGCFIEKIIDCNKKKMQVLALKIFYISFF